MGQIEEKSAGELCRNDVERLLADRYPTRLQRRDVIASGFDWSRDWSDTQLDQALHVLKKRCVIALDKDGYQLRTAPESYNARLVAERNAATPVAEPVPMSPAPAQPLYCTLCEVPFPTGAGIDYKCPCTTPARLEPPEPPAPGPWPPRIDATAARRALEELEKRLKAPRGDIDDLALKLEVLDHLGRILDDSIEAVLNAIADDLQR